MHNLCINIVESGVTQLSILNSEMATSYLTRLVNLPSVCAHVMCVFSHIHYYTVLKWIYHLMFL